MNRTIYHNEVGAWLAALAVVVVAFAVMEGLRSVAVRRVEARTREIDSDAWILAAAIGRGTRWPLLLGVALFLGSVALTLPSNALSLTRGVITLVLLAQVALWTNELIMAWVGRYRDRQLGVDAAAATTVAAMGFMARMVLWSVVFLLALDNLGVQITTLVAGVGIGGVAVALAVQNILADLFASLSIVLDKPFVLGDFIIVGEEMGTVEHVGLKTTRVRSLWGEQLIFANGDLLRSRIRNYGRMQERRVAFTVGVTYQTEYAKVLSIPDILREAVERQPGTRFDRAHFAAYGDSALNFEVVYYVLSPDYNLYMDLQQAINLAILQRFQEAGIEFAYPTRTLFVRRDDTERPVGQTG